MNEKINEELKSEYDLNDKDNLKISKNEKNFLIEKYESILYKYDFDLKNCTNYSNYSDSSNYIIYKYKERVE